ncbi:hypothetical protein ACR9VJ_16575 [Streptomyces sp. H49]|uniref:hypothetical protein n=1 Tax=Streptomyces sp. H49 TaxID=3444117 RepID=UPI003F4A89F0
MTRDTTTGATPRQRDRRSTPPDSPALTATASRAFAWLLILTGALGILASYVITVDKIQLVQDPHFSPSCDLSPPGRRPC